MSEIIQLVGQSCRPDQEERLTRWYDEQHIPDLLKFEGLTRVKRYELLHPVEPQFDYREKNYPQYLNIYEFVNEQAVRKYDGPWMRGSSSRENVRSFWENDPVQKIWRVQYRLVRVHQNGQSV